jgi:hypothetical protein
VLPVDVDSLRNDTVVCHMRRKWPATTLSSIGRLSRTRKPVIVSDEYRRGDSPGKR